MRTRARRAGLAATLAALLLGVGVFGLHAQVRAVLPHVSRTAAAPAHAVAAAGLPGLHAVGSALKRVPAADAVLAPAALLLFWFLLWRVGTTRAGRQPEWVPAAARARGPPRVQ
jgi:hypothetical protein